MAATRRKNIVRTRLTPLECSDYAALLLKKAGFVFSHAGRNGSTSCYYKFPGRVGTIRIGTHRVRNPEDRHWGELNAVASVTFSHRAVRDDGTYQRSVEGMENEIAQAIGRFFIKSTEA